MTMFISCDSWIFSSPVLHPDSCGETGLRFVSYLFNPFNIARLSDQTHEHSTDIIPFQTYLYHPSVYSRLSLEVEEDQTTNMMGVIQALISIYAESGDKLRSIKRGRHKIVFLLRSPVYLFGTSDWKEPDFVVSFGPLTSGRNRSEIELSRGLFLYDETAEDASGAFAFTIAIHRDRGTTEKGVRQAKQLRFAAFIGR
jgi:hypothetical protein